MIALIPIFLNPDDDFYTGTRGWDLICLFIESVINSKRINRAMVSTNNDFVKKHLTKFCSSSFKIKICDKIEMDSADILPKGSRSVIRSFKDFIERDADLIFINFRNPLLSSLLIDDAIDQFLSSGKSSTISVKEAVDSPCQLSTYYQLIDIRAIFLEDPKTDKNHFYDKVKHIFRMLSKDDFLITHPFYFNWESKNISARSTSGIYMGQHEAAQIIYSPIESFKGKGDSFFKKNHKFFIYQDQLSARLLSMSKIVETGFRMDFDASLAGLSISEDNGPVFLMKINNSKKLFLTIDRTLNANDDYIVKLHKINDLLQLESTQTELSINHKKHLYPVCENFEDSSGIIYSVLKYTENDTYDFEEPFKSTQKLWDINEQRTLINTKTGNSITGRQDFPEIYEPDGSFCIMRQEENNNFVQEIIHKQANAYILKENQSVQIQSELDFMNYCAILRSTQSPSLKENLNWIMRKK